jgi:2-polyprenyl-3-methyl-5-hydroxy-6-metoxy-1,4-benzoquinol methylase
MNNYCVLCQKENQHKLLSIHEGYNFLECQTCGLICLSPKPASLKDLYGEKYFLEKGYQDYENTYFKYQNIFEKLFQQRLKMIQKFKKSGKVLDVGCAHGFLLNFLKKNGYDCYGLDISEYAVKYAKNHFDIPIYQGDIDSADLPEKGFDIITMLDLIEHVANPVETLIQVKKFLKDDGILIVQTPYDIYHWEIVAKTILAGKKIGSSRPSAIPMHLYFFSPKTFKKLSREAGYKILKFETGTYGKVRMKINPPATNNIFSYIYYKLGLRSFLIKIAEFLKVSDGLNLILTK